MSMFCVFYICLRLNTCNPKDSHPNAALGNVPTCWLLAHLKKWLLPTLDELPLAFVSWRVVEVPAFWKLALAELRFALTRT
jgi:hypothetical protein